VFASANVALRFVLELAGLVAAYVVGSTLAPEPWKVMIGIGAAVLFGVVWGLWLAPKARFPQTARVRLVAGTVLLAAVAIGLALTAAPVAGVVLTVAIVLDALALAVVGTPEWAR
jgi:uncharacterized protein DUF2568